MATSISAPSLISRPQSLPASGQSSDSETMETQMSKPNFGDAPPRADEPSDQTPPTSQSDPSSQENVSARRIRTNEGLRVDVESQLELLPEPQGTRIGQTPIADSPPSRYSNTYAPKRTADGKIKNPDSVSPTSPSSTNHIQHSRNTSAASRISQASELSQKLKARLSLARVKVQNGWEDRTFNELDAMTSKNSSPVPQGSQLSPSSQSPPGNNGYHQQRIMQPSERASPSPVYMHATPRELLHSSGSDQRHPQSNPPPFASIQQPNTYESFWQIHASNAPQYSPPHPPQNTKPFLAPPVDIVSRKSHQSTGGGLWKSQGTAPNSPDTVPVTPSPKRQTVFRTPSQSAALEKDAVESLVIMSSPGNTGNRLPFLNPPLSSQSSPLRIPLSTVSETLSTTRSTQRRRDLPAHIHQNPAPSRKLATGADLDRELDEIANRASSSEED